MDDLRNINTFRETDVRMNNRKADIAFTQETHNVDNNEIETGNYKIYFSKAISGTNNNKGSGYVAIIIRKNLIYTIINVRLERLLFIV